MSRRTAYVTFLNRVSGLVSRGTTGIIIVVLARNLTPVQFAQVSLALSFSLAVSAFLVTALGDAAVYAFSARLGYARMVSALSLVIAALSIVAVLYAPTFALGASCVAHAIAFSADRVLRGPEAAIRPFLLGAPVGRLFAVTVWGETQGAALAALALITGGFAVVQASQGLLSAQPQPIVSRGGTAGPAVRVMALVAAMFLVVSQMDIVVIAYWMGSAALADYLPTMKMLEALTAVGIYWSIQAPHRFERAREAHREAISLSRSAVLAYGALALPTLALGPWLTPLLFGGRVEFLVLPALALVLGYAALTGLSPLLQWIAFGSVGSRRWVAIASMFVGVPVVCVAAVMGSLTGIAAGVAASYLVAVAVSTQQVSRYTRDKGSRASRET